MFDLFVSFANSVFGWIDTVGNGALGYLVATFNHIADFISG